MDLYSNKGDRVLTPFMGVGSEVYAAVKAHRFGIGVELKESYFKQTVKNLEAVVQDDIREPTFFDVFPELENMG